MEQTDRDTRRIRMRNKLIPMAALLAIAGASGLCAGDGHRFIAETVLYIWAGDQAGVAPDFLAVVDFDERSETYGKVIKTVPVPPPGNVGNEAHHCHLNSTGTVLGCGGLLSV